MKWTLKHEMLIWLYYDVTLEHECEYVLLLLCYALVCAIGMCMKDFNVTCHAYKQNVPLCMF